MKISEMMYLITSVWFNTFAMPFNDTDTFEPTEPSITGDMEIEDSFKNVITVEKVYANSRIADIHFGKLFTVEIYINKSPYNKSPYEYAPTSMFHEQIYRELLKIGWVKTVYATMILCQSGLKRRSDRRMNIELLITRAIYDGIPEMLSNILNTDWHKLSYDFQTETHTFMKNGTDFQVYGEIDNDWIKDFVTERFDAMMKDCQSHNFIECAAVLLRWKEKNQTDNNEEDMGL